MKSFKDRNGADVTLAFEQNAFGREPDHVLIICRYLHMWLLTNHKKRGWEFPGGKREPGEALAAAAAREVFEETGGSFELLHFIGEYEVKESDHAFIKRIYFAEMNKLTNNDDYLETNGPVFEAGDLIDERFKEHYSFIMKDDIIRFSLEKLQAAGMC